MENKELMREKPKKEHGSTEFFLQKAESLAVSCRAHIHRAVEFLYVNSGNYHVILDGSEYDIEKGDLILFCSDSMHHVQAGELAENDYYVIKIPPSFFLEMSELGRGAEYVMRFAVASKDSKCLWRKSELENSSIKTILDMLIHEYNAKGYAWEVAVRLKIMELLLAILRERNTHSEPMQNQTTEAIYNVILYVRKNFSQDINEKELAESFGMSYSYFSRSFRRVTGVNFKKYLNQTRINRAEQMLITGDRSVSEIAMECGYNSISYFISVYKSFKGTTPLKTAAKKSPTVK